MADRHTHKWASAPWDSIASIRNDLCSIEGCYRVRYHNLDGTKSYDDTTPEEVDKLTRRARKGSENRPGARPRSAAPERGIFARRRVSLH